MSASPESFETIRHVVIRGGVQGVGFRAWTQYTAQKHGLAGWVRNRRDSAVEALFAGSAATVAAMVEACRRGPRGARVDTLDQREGTPAELALRGAGVSFSVLATA